MDKYEEIIAFLDDAGVEYELHEHAPAKTSKQAEEIAGFPMDCGAKSIVFKLDKQFVLVVIRGNNLADFNKLRKIFKSRKARLASPEEVINYMGVEIGSCYPFPNISGLDGVVDKSLAKCEKITFSPGSSRHHIRMKWQDYLKISGIKLADLTRD